jgi:ribosomal protein S18 acetylase RimI-like enzyme
VDEVEITRGGRERLDELEPLWGVLSAHHVAVAPQLAELWPVRSSSESWARWRAFYEEWLADPDAFVLVASAGGEPVGYALVDFHAGEESWSTGERIAELQTLVVTAEWRSRGLGRRLVEAMFDELRRLGVRDWSVAAIASNADAIRFYERLGLTPYLVSFIGRVP